MKEDTKMDKPEIEKLAEEYMFANYPSAREEGYADPYFVAGFKAGYLKGVEAERKRCIEITNKIIEKEVSPFGARSIKEQIERGSDE